MWLVPCRVVNMWQVQQSTFNSRLLLGTAQYPSPHVLQQAIAAARTEIITVSLRRHMGGDNGFWKLLKTLPYHFLPNTAGCFSIKEAVNTAKMGRELFETNRVKLEIIGDDYTLHPNSLELVKAAEILVHDGFEVWPYCTDDMIVCQRLLEVGCSVLMPGASPIGTAKGLVNPYALRLLRERFLSRVLIIDAGIGKPSDAVLAMEMGFDAVLLNSAVALAANPIKMAKAFAGAIEAGRLGYEAGLLQPRDIAVATTPVIGRAFQQSHQQTREEVG